VNERHLQSLAEYGTVTFRLPDWPSGTHRHQCRWQTGGRLLVEEAGTFAEALEKVFVKAVCEGDLSVIQSRVITRVMDDGIETKDGAA